MGMKLLSLTRKFQFDIDFLPRGELYLPPIDRATSRLRYKPDFFHFAKDHESVEELLALKMPARSWDECCYERAEELRDLNKNHYYISYSGGIDSTALMVAMLQTWPKADLDKVTILMSHHSVHENPSFFDHYVSKFKLRNFVRGVSKNLLDEDALLLTGELGDQLFGSDMLMTGCLLFGDEVLHKDYREFAPAIFDRLLQKKAPNMGGAIFEHLHPIVEECPFPVRTTHDFFWWYNFTQKWQHVKCRYMESADWDLRTEYGRHVVNFFDTPAFQLWSLNNHDLKIGKTWDSYKKVSKEFIYKFTRDPAHLELRKIQSLVKTYFLLDRRVAINERRQALTDVQELRDYVRYDV